MALMAKMLIDSIPFIKTPQITGLPLIAVNLLTFHNFSSTLHYFTRPVAWAWGLWSCVTEILKEIQYPIVVFLSFFFKAD